MVYPSGPGAAKQSTYELAHVYENPPKAPRPWVVLSMIQSIDGSISAGGVSGTLANATDAKLFGILRRRADVLLVGAGTAKAEGYRPLTRSGQRLAIVTASGELPWDQPVYTHHQTIIVAPLDGPPLPVPALRAGHGHVDLAAALQLLDPTVVLLEGGSNLNGQCLALGLVDEICLTIAPVAVAGRGPRVAAFDAETLRAFSLVHVLEDDGYLFCRYRAKRTATS